MLFPLYNTILETLVNNLVVPYLDHLVALHVTLTYALAIIVGYMRHLYKSGAGYSTVNFHRSGISKFHVGINGISIGEHPLVSQAVKTVFRLRPPLPKYQSTFDIVSVLAYVQSLHTASISLHLLSFKALFLTVYSSISRVSCMARLGSSLLEQR